MTPQDVPYATQRKTQTGPSSGKRVNTHRTWVSGTPVEVDWYRDTEGTHITSVTIIEGRRQLCRIEDFVQELCDLIDLVGLPKRPNV